MTWRPVDCHAHTTFSDGALSVAELVACAARRHVRPSVSDHVTTATDAAVRTTDGVVAYLDVLDQYDVLRGAEFCWHDTLWRELPDGLWERFTHTIGSLHAIFLTDGSLMTAYARTAPPGLTVRAYMDAYLANAERLAREMPVDILAHPAFVSKLLHGVAVENLWTEEREERLVEALFQAGIAFEVSAQHPAPDSLVRRAADRGVRLSLASDGHSEADVADIGRPLALCRALGVPDAMLYDPSAHGSRMAARWSGAQRASK